MHVRLKTLAVVLFTTACPRPAARPVAVDAAVLGYHPSYVYFDGCPEAAKAIVTRFALPRDSVHQCLAQQFVIGPSDTVTLAHVAFGEPPDCMAGGCFYQHVCAVVDGASVLLFAYHFLSRSSHHTPETLMGRHHRIVRDSSFLQFYHAIIRGGWEGVPRSAWRYCTDHLPLDFSSAPQRQPQN